MSFHDRALPLRRARSRGHFAEAIPWMPFPGDHLPPAARGRAASGGQSARPLWVACYPMPMTREAPPLPEFVDVLSAAARIAPHARRTPVLRSQSLDAIAGCALYFKCENLQRVGAFKFRGACNAIFALDDEVAARGILTQSSGNHGAAVALAARLRGVPATVVVPEGAPKAKLDGIAGYGARIVRCAPNMAARTATAAALQAESGAHLVHPFDDAHVIAGQGTAALELLREVDGLDALLTPVGGGGLLSGSALVAKTLDSRIAVLGAEPTGAADAAASLAEARCITDMQANTVCDGLRGHLAPRTLAMLRAYADGILIVDDRDTLAAMRLLLLMLLWLCGVALYIVHVGNRDELADASVRGDAIIVLGAAAYDARPSPVFEERLRHGIDLYKAERAPTLIFTGGFGGSGARFAESQVGRRYALRRDVPDRAILIETSSRNTRENLGQAAALMRSRKLTRAIVVSDPLHMARALRICEEIGLDCLGSPTPTTRYRSFETRWRFLANEVYFFHRDRIARLRENNGDSP